MKNHSKKPVQRTKQQNKAIHKLFQLWADALNDAGKGMFTVLKEEVDIPWKGSSVEQYIWNPLLAQQDDLENTHNAFTDFLATKIEIDTLPSLEDITAVKLQKGLRVYFEIVAKALNDAGAEMRIVLKPNVEVWWSGASVKEFIWRPVQVAKLGKKSTTELLTGEIDEVYDTVNRHLGKHIDTVMFPSIEDIIIQLQSYEQER